MHVIYPSKVCPMLFMSSKLSYLILNSISNSFINKNRLIFMPINKTNFEFLNLQNLELDINYESLSKEILNKHLFKKTEIIIISCSNLYGVDDDLFKENSNLELVEWFIQNIRQFYYTTQNKWFKSIKYYNQKLDFNFNKPCLIALIEFNESEFNFYEFYEYPDEDFCLFIDFQTKHSIYSLIDPGKKINCTCTVIWILKYTEVFYHINETNDYYPYIIGSSEFKIPLSYCLYKSNHNDLLKRCDFETKIKLCKTSEFPKVNQNIYFNTDLDLINLVKFIQYILFVYLNEIFAFIGIVTNIIVIIVISNIKNLKKGKTNEANNEKNQMFIHILIHSVFNVFYCFIMAFRPINICLFFTPSLFCSSIAIKVEAQWFKIIFIEYFGNIAKICCNVSYIAISVSRIFLTGGKKKNKGWLYRFNYLNIKVYLVLLVLSSSVMSIFKFFQYTLNRLTIIDNLRYDIFSKTKYNDFNCSLKKPNDFMNCNFWDTWMIVNNFFNDICFFFVTIIFDVVVLKSISSMINSKKTMVENFKEAEEEKKRKRILKMIIINGIIFTLSHLPDFILSILSLKLQKNLLICSYFECTLLNEIGQFFIYFSIMSQLSINKNFNSLFKESFDNIVLKFKKKFEHNQNKNLTDK